MATKVRRVRTEARKSSNGTEERSWESAQNTSATIAPAARGMCENSLMLIHVDERCSGACVVAREGNVRGKAAPAGRGEAAAVLAVGRGGVLPAGAAAAAAGAEGGST